MRRIPELVAGFLLGFATLLVIFLLSSDIAAHYEVCETTKEGAKECARYGVVHFALHKLGTILDAYNGVVTAMATAFIAWFTLSLRQATDRLWDAGERQLKASERALVAGERAWIKVDIEVGGNLTIDASGTINLPFSFTVTNCGNSPATDVRIYSHMMLKPPGQNKTLETYRRFSARVKLRVEKQPLDNFRSYTLFPNEAKTIRVNNFIMWQQVKESNDAWREAVKGEFPYFELFMVGVATYHIPFDVEQHQSGFSVDIRRVIEIPHEGRGLGLFSHDQTFVEASHMAITDSVWGSPSID
jgi:hypothetical protein